MEDNNKEIRQRLIEAGGRMSQDLGLGRIAGQALVYLYLSREECSLDLIGEDLELSKASVSIAARQLERLGMIVRVRKKGDRKSYYRTADNFIPALQQGIVEFVRQKMQTVGVEIEYAHSLLHEEENEAVDDPDLIFLGKRVDRAMVLKRKVEKVFDNPFVNLLARKKK
ncbi:MAG TPA: hypothetical protein EYP18_00975 [Desulfobacterales bacterium]|nr:hypothetical protein [Desulfobacterales bacterium]